MDEPTGSYYAASADELAERFERSGSGSGIEKYFELAFARGMRVLDIGAGSGRDMARLLGVGCDVYGVEPCGELLSCALKRHPELAGRITPGQLPNLPNPFGHRFDGVLCSAVLMHLHRESIPAAALAIKRVLREHGRLLLGIPHGRPGLDPQCRDEHGRLYTALGVSDLELLFEQLGFRILGKWHTDDSQRREGHSWWILLFELGRRAMAERTIASRLARSNASSSTMALSPALTPPTSSLPIRSRKS